MPYYDEDGNIVYDNYSLSGSDNGGTQSAARKALASAEASVPWYLQNEGNYANMAEIQNDYSDLSRWRTQRDANFNKLIDWNNETTGYNRVDPSSGGYRGGGYSNAGSSGSSGGVGTGTRRTSGIGGVNNTEYYDKLMDLATQYPIASSYTPEEITRKGVVGKMNTGLMRQFINKATAGIGSSSGLPLAAAKELFRSKTSSIADTLPKLQSAAWNEALGLESNRVNTANSALARNAQATDATNAYLRNLAAQRLGVEYGLYG